MWGLAAVARERFASRLAASSAAGAKADTVRLVFDDYVRVIEELRDWGLPRITGDSRVMWIPLQLALRPEQYDTQQELDAILSRAQRTPLVGGNHVFYWNGQQWQLTLHRSILEARDYHVLWLHDYDGVDHGGDADTICYFITVEGYLKALTERVREFDRTGSIPAYMILVDLNYWEANKGRLYTDVLQDPLHAQPKLPRQDVEQNRKMQAGVERALGELREAVAGSKRLQEEAARRGQGWLRQYVSVHLSVMNPADFSYRTSRLIGYLPIAPDTIVRDHRKIIFFDVTELDPGKGAAIYGGVGVGEQYASATWEDRAVRLAGPAALSVKDAARRYLKANGFKDEEIPAPLRPLPKPADYDARVKAARGAAAGRPRRWRCTTTAASPQKDASIASAVLYTLMPPGSLIVVPDSIWTHELWAAQLLGAALRGCHVYVIAPAAANAPSAGLPAAVADARDLEPLHRGPAGSSAPRSRQRGGRLRVGLYTRAAGVDDLEAQLGEMHQTFERYPFLKEDFPFPEEFYARVGKGAEVLAAAGYVPADDRLPEDARARSPKMHRKTQLFVSGDALAAIVRDKRTQDVIVNQTRFIARQGLVFEPEELQKARIDLAAIFHPYLDVVRDLPRAGAREGRDVHDGRLAQQGRARHDDRRRGAAGDRGCLGDVGRGGHVDPHRIHDLDREPGGARPAAAALQAVAAARRPLGAEGDLAEWREETAMAEKRNPDGRSVFVVGSLAVATALVLAGCANFRRLNSDLLFLETAYVVGATVENADAFQGRLRHGRRVGPWPRARSCPPTSTKVGQLGVFAFFVTSASNQYLMAFSDTNGNKRYDAGEPSWFFPDVNGQPTPVSIPANQRFVSVLGRLGGVGRASGGDGGGGSASSWTVELRRRRRRAGTSRSRSATSPTSTIPASPRCAASRGSGSRRASRATPASASTFSSPTTPSGFRCSSSTARRGRRRTGGRSSRRSTARSTSPGSTSTRSGRRLEGSARALNYGVELLHDRFRFDRLYVVAHSMGGLVSKVVPDQERARRPQQLHHEVRLDLDSLGRARSGRDGRQVQARGRAFLARHGRGQRHPEVAPSEAAQGPRRSPAALRHPRKSSLVMPDENDGTVSVKSQLNPAIKADAVRVIGYDATHVGILSRPDVIRTVEEFFAGQLPPP